MDIAQLINAVLAFVMGIVVGVGITLTVVNARNTQDIVEKVKKDNSDIY